MDFVASVEDEFDILITMNMQAEIETVGQLIAEGTVDLGFQQLSEMQGLDGIRILGLMPAGCEIVTTFAAALGASCQHPEAARKALAYLASSPQAQAVKQRHGMS